MPFLLTPLERTDISTRYPEIAMPLQAGTSEMDSARVPEIPGRTFGHFEGPRHPRGSPPGSPWVPCCDVVFKAGYGVAVSPPDSP